MENIEQQTVLKFFKDRTIEENILREFEITWNNKFISIPIRDKNKKTIFYKYRRLPWENTGPKYWYDSGASSALFNIDLIEKNNEIIICEGELDAICLCAHGYNAVSSTGGSGTFNEEWRDLFIDKEVYICYDNDDAGYKGALRVQGIIPWAKIIWLPTIQNGKDVTDYFSKPLQSHEKTLSFFLISMQLAISYRVPLPLKEIPKDKKELEKIIKEDEAQAEEIKLQERELKSEYVFNPFLKILREYLLSRIENHKRALKHHGESRAGYEENGLLSQAKQIPISAFVLFNPSNKANCIWHNEKTPSMQYYPKDNRVYCFGCSKGGDVIDVVQQTRKIGTKEAIKVILESGSS